MNSILPFSISILDDCFHDLIIGIMKRGIKTMNKILPVSISFLLRLNRYGIMDDGTLISIFKIPFLVPKYLRT